jgi:hypothetical protein
MIEGELTLEIHLTINRIIELNRISDEFGCNSFDTAICLLMEYYRKGRTKQMAWINEEESKK